MLDVQTIDIAQLKEVQTPLATETHVPVPHIHVRDMLAQNLNMLGMEFTSERIQTTHDGNRAIGMLYTEPMDGIRFSAGWMNAHDKSSSTKFLAGEEVFICTNGQVFAEFMVRRKHTMNILRDLEQLAYQAVVGFKGAQELNQHRQDAYEAVSLTSDSARAMAVRLAEHRVIAPSQIVNLIEEYESPSFGYDRNVQTVWGLNAAATHNLKNLTNPMLHQQRTLELAIMLDREVSFKLGEDFRKGLEIASSV